MPELERELVALGAVLDAPAVDLRTGVASMIAAEPARRRRRRIALIAVVALLGAGGAAAPVVARWLGVGAVEVKLGDPPATVAPGRAPGYGTRVTLRVARRDAGFAVRVPAALGAPSEVWLDRLGRARVVWLVYPDALVAQTDAAIADQMLATKFASGAQVERVDELDGLWIAGAHAVAFHDDSGGVLVDQLRLSDSVLLWEHEGVTLRVETRLGRDDALRIARSF